MPRRNSLRWDIPVYDAPAPPAPRPRPGAIRCSDFACASDAEKTVHAAAVARVVARAEGGPEVRRGEGRRPRSAGARVGRDGDGGGGMEDAEITRPVRRQMGRRPEVAPAGGKAGVGLAGGAGGRREVAEVGAGFSALWADRRMGSGGSGVGGRIVRTREGCGGQMVGGTGSGGGSSVGRCSRGGVVGGSRLDDIDDWSDATSTVGTESVYEGGVGGGGGGGRVSRCGSRVDAGSFGASFNRSFSECLSEGASGGGSMVVSEQSVIVGVSEGSDEGSSDDGDESGSVGVGGVVSDESEIDGVLSDESVIEGVIEGLGREDSVIEAGSEGIMEDGAGDFRTVSEMEAPLSLFFHHGTSLSSTQSGRFADADPLASTPVSTISSRDSEGAGVGEAFWNAWREERKRRRSSVA